MGTGVSFEDTEKVNTYPTSQGDPPMSRQPYSRYPQRSKTGCESFSNRLYYTTRLWLFGGGKGGRS